MDELKERLDRLEKTVTDVGSTARGARRLLDSMEEERRPDERCYAFLALAGRLCDLADEAGGMAKALAVEVGKLEREAPCPLPSAQVDDCRGHAECGQGDSATLGRDLDVEDIHDTASEAVDAIYGVIGLVETISDSIFAQYYPTEVPDARFAAIQAALAHVVQDVEFICSVTAKAARG